VAIKGDNQEVLMEPDDLDVFRFDSRFTRLISLLKIHFMIFCYLFFEIWSKFSCNGVKKPL